LSSHFGKWADTKVLLRHPLPPIDSFNKNFAVVECAILSKRKNICIIKTNDKVAASEGSWRFGVILNPARAQPTYVAEERQGTNE
jgi:hypothetical protein